ncbi:MAG: tRNA 2-thiouridine(34) synthase MnmA [Halanaerobiales bacterium]
MKKVLVAMSGGVDSSVAAALLKERGFEVIGGTMDILPPAEAANRSPGDEAAKIASELSIPHYIFDLKAEFREKIINNFAREYGNARTPNPCVICNREIKFGLLRQKAIQLGCDYFATGHYARSNRDQTGRYLLKKPFDPEKDQTYMLYRLTQSQLEMVLFPLGELTKTEVRDKAREIGLDIYDKKESQEICFIKDDDYKRFLNQYYPELSEPGPIFDINGKRLGQHKGLHHYTIGQRRGLGISLPYPVYVVEMDRDKNALIVGEDKKVFSRGLIVESVNWIVDNERKEYDFPLACRVKIRYNSPEVEALICGENELINVKFKQKQRAVTPGQSAVFYRNDTVLGGGIIKERKQ